MPRRSTESEVYCRVRALRLAVGLTQAELCERADITRQTLSTIETGRNLPNMGVALRLAAALGCRLDDLFSLEPVATVAAELVGDPEAVAVTGRVALARVGARTIARPLDGSSGVQHGLVGADGLVVARQGGRVTARLLTERELEEATLVGLGCDPAMSLVAAQLNRKQPRGRLLWFNLSSRAALAGLARGESHFAGCHLRDAATGEYNVAHAAAALSGDGALLVTYAHWEQGLILPPGNPKRIRGIDDLARSNVGIVNREAGAGSRALLDELLTGAGIEPAAVVGYDRVAPGHLAVAEAVAHGLADAGVGIAAAARAYGLDFVPLARERYDLVIPLRYRDHPLVDLLLDLLQTRLLRDEIAALGGYDVGSMGAVVARIPASAA